MNRTIRHILLWGSLLGLLVGCGQVPGENSSISGIVRAPTGEDVAGTRVFACYENEKGCDALGEVEITASGTSSSYQLGTLPVGRYGVYALKDANQDGVINGNGDLYGYYNPRAGQSSLVTPPAENIDIQMILPNGAGNIPQVLDKLQLKTP